MQIKYLTLLPLLLLLFGDFPAKAFPYGGGANGIITPNQITLPSANLQAIYSVIKYQSWSGPCLRAHRASDHTEQDIGFVNGICDVASAMAFASPGTPLVAKWYDESGAGCDASQTSEGSMPSFTSFNMINNIPGVTYGLLTIGPCLATSTHSETVFEAYSSQASNCGLYQINATESGGNVSCLGLLHPDDVLLSANAQAETGLYTNTRPIISAMTSASGSKTYNLNGTLATGITATTLATTSGGKIGQTDAGSGFQYIGQNYMLAVYSDVKDQTPVVAPNVTTLAATFKTTTNGTSRVTFDGDSITEGTGATLDVNNPFQAAPLLNKPTYVRDIGVFGETLATMLSQESGTIVNAKINGIKNIVLIAGGENDICSGSASAASVFANLQSYVTNAQNAGYTVIAGTLIYDNATGCGNGTSRDTARQTYNNDVRTNAISMGVTVADYDSITQLQFPQTAGYSADGTHPTTLGYSVMAPVAAAAINAVLP